MSPVVHSTEETLSARQRLSWLALTMAAGASNAGAFLACQRFVTHVTGTVTRVGLDVEHAMLMLEYALVLTSFILGAFLSVLTIQARSVRGLKPMAWLPLAVVVVLLVVVAMLGHVGWFGEMGGTVEEPSDFALLCVLALAMGLMNAAVASSTALAVRTTHMTGPATDVGVLLGVALFSRAEARAQALRVAWLRASTIVAFIAGAMVMVEIVEALDFLSFLVPAALVAFGTLRSFAPVLAPSNPGDSAPLSTSSLKGTP